MTTGTGAPRLRRDVARNRALLLSAANDLLAERGMSFTLHELARASGLGVATVYRHFPDRDTLLDALVVRRFTAMRAVMSAAAALPDPIVALRAALRGISDLHVRDRAAREATLSNAARDRELAEQMLRPVADVIVARALKSGRLRPDVQETDVPVLFLLNGALIDALEHVRPGLSRRYLDALLDGLLIAPADRMGGGTPAPTPPELRAVLDGIRPAGT